MKERPMHFIMRVLTWWPWSIPWRVTSWLGSFEVWCWADLVYWRESSRDQECPPRRNSGCAKITQVDGRSCLTCYCGFWDDHDACGSHLNRRPASTGELP